MAIKDLEARQGNVDVVAIVTDKGEERTFQKFGKEGRVCNATIKDDSGEIKLTLWDDDIDKVKVGDKIHITNGYVNEWQGEKQLTTGKFGKLEVVGKSEGGESPSEAGTTESKPEEPPQVEPEVQEETVTEEKVE